MDVRYGFFRFIFHFFAGLFSGGEAPQYIVMTYNIDNNIEAIVPYDWDSRKEYVTEYIFQYNPDIISFQEVSNQQLQHIATTLPDYKSVGVDNKGNTTGLYTPIFYNKYNFEMLETGDFWLSETPTKAGSTHWDKNSATATWLVLKNKHSKKQLLCINTNFNFSNSLAKEKSAQLIYDFIAEKTGKKAVLLCGSFGANKQSNYHQILTTNSKNKQLLFDAQYNARQQYIDVESTYNGYGKNNTAGFVDGIFVNKYIAVESIEIPAIMSNDGYASDHSPVIIRASIYKKAVNK